MAVTIRARFLGANGSMGFIKGEIYILTVHESRVVSPKNIPYGSVEAFLRNWLPLAKKENLDSVSMKEILSITDVKEIILKENDG